MQSDSKHVNAKPGEARHDIAKDGHDHQASWSNVSAPARVKDERAPEHDEDSAIFLRIPSPESAPRLISPNAAEDRADETKEGSETDHAISHTRERSGGSFIE